MLIDPPDDAASRFTLPERAAALYTTGAGRAALATLDRHPGGTAHVRVGDHLIDIHTQENRAIAHLPALGILCGGDFGSDQSLPLLSAGSDGSEELEVLRLLARLARERAVRLYIPQQGDVIRDRITLMERLSDDVSYLHGLRRVIPLLADQGMNAAVALADTLLPAGRNSPACRRTNIANVQTLFLATTHAQN